MSQSVNGILCRMRASEWARQIGQRLRAARDALGLNAREFGRGARIPPNALSQYEKGEDRRLTIGPAIRICEEYGLTLDYLYRNQRWTLPADLRMKIAEQIPDEEPPLPPAPLKKGGEIIRFRPKKAT
jgi:transcriptional regulator with XRE-family HTH domain